VTFCVSATARTVGAVASDAVRFPEATAVFPAASAAVRRRAWPPARTTGKVTVKPPDSKVRSCTATVAAGSVTCRVSVRSAAASRLSVRVAVTVTSVPAAAAVGRSTPRSTGACVSSTARLADEAFHLPDQSMAHAVSA
jgi:hypothetical protein